MLLSLGIAGIQFVGADVPGFFGNPSSELFVKFYQLGAFYPFFRAHAHIDFPNREPYDQNEFVQRGIKAALDLRYNISAYLYT
mmetsp:Transcript_209/g.135  ORF Transcript_209/g.135 Transcript_209/m.135 type:complete len:83 (+) Transcript_209:440-688(+)